MTTEALKQAREALQAAHACILLDRTALADTSVNPDGTFDEDDQAGLDEYAATLCIVDEAVAALDAAIAQEARHIDVLRAERDHARACFVKVSAVLTSIHSLLYPAPIALEDGRTMVFRPSDPDPHAVLQALSDRIRAIPDDVGSGAQEAADREDAERWCLAVEKLGTLRAFLAGWRGTESCRRNGLESTVDEWDAGLAALGGLYIAARAKEKSNV